MSTFKCPACGASARKGSAVLLLGEESEGSTGRRARVCTYCANRGLVIVPMKRPPVKVEKPATSEVDFGPLVRQLRKLARMAEISMGEQIPMDPEYCEFMGKQQGLLDAATLIEKFKANGGKL